MPGGCDLPKRLLAVCYHWKWAQLPNLCAFYSVFAWCVCRTMSDMSLDCLWWGVAQFGGGFRGGSLPVWDLDWNTVLAVLHDNSCACVYLTSKSWRLADDRALGWRISFSTWLLSYLYGFHFVSKDGGIFIESVKRASESNEAVKYAQANMNMLGPIFTKLSLHAWIV